MPSSNTDDSEELESVFSDIDGELWYAHPRMAKGNVANEITLAERIAELRQKLDNSK